MIRSFFILSLLLIAITNEGVGQRSNNWCFGWHCGITFNNNPAQPFASSIYGDNPFNQSIRPQTISDCKGNLLFYTGGGSYIWNREHKPLRSSINLAANNLNNMFVPSPGDDSLYYLFQASNDSFQLSYLLIDLRQDSGRGDVVKRVEFSDSDGYFGGFIKHANDTDYWILFKTSNYTIHAYLLTKNGVNKKPVSSPCKGGEAGTTGNSPYMRSSNNGRYIISPEIKFDFKYKYYIYEFDNNTGKVFNPRPLILKTDARNWNFSFSPNDSILFGIRNLSKDSFSINQIPVYSSQPYQNINEVIKYQSIFAIGSCQLGADNRIYVDAWKDTTGYSVFYMTKNLSYIPYPDKWGKSCGLIMDGIQFNFDSCGVYSQKFPCNSFPVKRINNKFDVTGSDGCVNDTASVRFTADADSAFKSYNWYFGDGDSAVGKSVVHQYKNAGSYYVKLGCELGSCGYMQWVGDSVTIKFKPTVSLSTNKNIYCGYQTVAAQINYRYSDTVQVAWGDGTDTLLYVADTNLVDSTQLQHIYNKSGNYAITCKAWNPNCYDSVANVYNIIIDTLPKSSFAADYITSCGTKSILLTDTSKFDSVIINRTWHIYKAAGFDTTFTAGNVNNVAVLFNDTGMYSVKLTLQSRQGCIDSLEKINFIQINPFPVSKISGKTSWCGADSTTLTASGGNKYKWSTGDTTTSVFLKPIISNYYSVTVTNVYNCSVKDSAYISVGKIVSPLFKPDYLSSCGNSTITLTDSSGGMDSIIQQRKWAIEFPNNTVKQYDTASNNKLKLIVQDTGYYNAKLVYITKQGCMDSLYKTKVFRILPQPVVYIDSPSHNPLCFGDSFILTAKQRDINYPSLVTFKWNTGLVNTPSIKVDTANSYYVAASNAYGCGAQSNTVKISFLPQLFANIKKATDSLYVVATRKIVSYAWYKDSILYNTTSSLYHPPSGRYYVHVEDANGCVATSGSLLYTTGINYINEEVSGIRVYPNPVHDVLYVEWSSQPRMPMDGNGERSRTMTNQLTRDIAMYDMMGRSVLQFFSDDSSRYISGTLTTTNQKQLSVGYLPKGLYILSVGGEKIKIVIE